LARVEIEWSPAALADLSRFAAFLQENHPRLAPIVAAALVEKAEILVEFPALGRPDYNRPEYRQLVLRVLNTAYVFQYRYDGRRIVMLRVFHGREDRTPGDRE
jgi:plasmid stabilization system protein ParE